MKWELDVQSDISTNASDSIKIVDDSSIKLDNWLESLIYIRKKKEIKGKVKLGGLYKYKKKKKMVKSRNSVEMDGRKDPIGMEKKWKVLNEWYLGERWRKKSMQCEKR